MTANRMSMLFRPESDYMDGGQGNWYAPPPGTTWNDTYKRATVKSNAMGAKAFQAVSYGNITATFNWKFTLDYNYLEPLALAYECWHDGKALDEDRTVGPNNRFKRIQLKEADNTHVFYKTDSKRTKSFAARVVTLHRQVGGLFDEVRIIKGCVPGGISYQYTTPTIQCTLSGVCATQDVYFVYAETTDYQPISSDTLVEWACFLQDGQDFVKTIESVSFKSTAQISSVYSSCGPSPQNYYEGGSTYTLDLTAYTDDFNKFKTRTLFSGGDEFSGDYAMLKTNDEEQILGKRFTAAVRGLRPMKKAVIQSSTTNMVAQSDNPEDENGAGDNGNGISMTQAFTFGKSTETGIQKANAFKMTLFNGFITSDAKWDGQNNNKLTEQLSLEGNMMVMEFVTNNPRIWKNYVKKNELAFGTWGTEGSKVNSPIMVGEPGDTYDGCPFALPAEPAYIDITTSTDTCTDLGGN